MRLQVRTKFYTIVSRCFLTEKYLVSHSVDDRESSSKGRQTTTINEDDTDLQIASAEDYPVASTSTGESNARKRLPSSNDEDEVREASPTAKRPSKSDSQSRFKELGEFSSLHRYYVWVNRTKQKKSDEESDMRALNWCECWQALGYDYRKLLSMVAFYENRQKTEGNKNELGLKLWKKLNGVRDQLSQGDSVSFVVDRTIEHYKLVIEKRMKERAKIKKKTETVTLDSSPEPSTSAVVKQDPVPQQQPAVQQQHQQQQVQQTQAATSGAKPNATLDQDVVMAQTEFYEFMTRKLGEAIRNSPAYPTLQQQQQATRTAADGVLSIVRNTQVHPSTLIAWYEIDLERNGNKLSNFPLLLNAYFGSHASLLPRMCSLNALVAFIISYSIETRFRGRFKRPEAYASYDNAVVHIRQQQQQQMQMQQQMMQQQQQMQQQQFNYQQPPPNNQYKQESNPPASLTPPRPSFQKPPSRSTSISHDPPSTPNSESYRRQTSQDQPPPFERRTSDTDRDFKREPFERRDSYSSEASSSHSHRRKRPSHDHHDEPPRSRRRRRSSEDSSSRRAPPPKRLEKIDAEKFTYDFCLLLIAC